jgi:deoxyribonuclease-4
MSDLGCGCSCSPGFQTELPKIKVIDLHHRVGANVNLEKTLLKTLTQKGALGSHCVQFYLSSRQGYKVRRLDKKDIEDTKKYCDNNGKSFYIHCPLIANLSKNGKSKDSKEIEILSNSWKAVTSITDQLNGLPSGAVLHVGSRGNISNLINNLNDMDVPRNKHIKQKKLLLLENAAGQGTSLGRDFDEIRNIFEGLDKNTIGFCLDTQHVFGAGVNALSNHDDIVKLFDDIEEATGNLPDVIHLNDSKKEFSGKVDRHENIGSGYIWKYNDEGLKSLLDICYDKDIDCILETPDSCRDLDLIRTKYMDLETIDTYKNDQ